MNLILLLLGLPVLLGYVVFVGISGRFSPFSKPVDLVDRPQWFLGLGTATALSSVVCISAFAVHALPLNQLDKLWQPSLSLLATLLAINTGIYFWYRHKINQVLLSEPDEHAQFAEAYLSTQAERLHETEQTIVTKYDKLPIIIDYVADYSDDSFVETQLFEQTLALADIDPEATIQLSRTTKQWEHNLTEKDFSDTQLEY